MRKAERAVIRAERALITAVMGKPWGLLAAWMEKPFPLQHIGTIITDLRRVDFACAALARSRRKR